MKWGAGHRIGARLGEKKFWFSYCNYNEERLAVGKEEQESDAFCAPLMVFLGYKF